jgi:hypothetical protein
MNSFDNLNTFKDKFNAFNEKDIFRLGCQLMVDFMILWDWIEFLMIYKQNLSGWQVIKLRNYH